MANVIVVACGQAEVVFAKVITVQKPQSL